MNYLFIVIVLLWSLPGFAQEASALNGVVDDCPDEALFREASEQQRQQSFNNVGEPLYLSKQYCFVITGLAIERKITDMPIAFTRAELALHYRNYKQILAVIGDVKQQALFVHFYLKQLTRHYIVAPESNGEHRARIIVGFRFDSGKKAGQLLDLMPHLSHSEALRELNALQVNPPKAEDNLKLLRLVKLLLSSEKRLQTAQIEAGLT